MGDMTDVTAAANAIAVVENGAKRDVLRRILRGGLAVRQASVERGRRLMDVCERAFREVAHD